MIIDQATPEHLLELMGDNFDKMLAVIASTAEGKARILTAIRKKASVCETHFSDYESMKTGEKWKSMMDPKTRIKFEWSEKTRQLDVEKDDEYHLSVEFMEKGQALGFQRSVGGIYVNPNPVDKQRLLDLCKSEGMDPGALVCLDFFLEQQWFSDAGSSSSNNTT